MAYQQELNSNHETPLKNSIDSQPHFQEINPESNKNCNEVHVLDNEEVVYEELNEKPHIVVPLDCLTAVSMPTNWSHVERLKQQRLMLHKQLFSQKLNIRNDEKLHTEVVTEIGENGGDVLKTGNNNGGFTNVIKETEPAYNNEKSMYSHYLYSGNSMFDADTDMSSSDDYDDDDTPPLQIDESYENAPRSEVSEVSRDDDLSQSNGIGGNGRTGEVTNLNGLLMYSGYVQEENEFGEHNNSCDAINTSDLCDLTASRINEALYDAIASANVSKEKERKLQVLNSLKMKAEEKANTKPEKEGYKISKYSETGSSKSASFLSVNSDNSSNSPLFTTDIKVNEDSINIVGMDPAKHLGLPVKFDNLAKEYKTFEGTNLQQQKEILCKVQCLDTQASNSKDTTITVVAGTSLIKKNLDATNILEISCQTNGFANRAGENTISDDKEKLDYKNIALQKLLAEKRLNFSVYKDSVVEHHKEKDTAICKEETVLSTEESEFIAASGAGECTAKEMSDTDRSDTDNAIKTDESNPCLSMARKLNDQQREFCRINIEARMGTGSPRSMEIEERLNVAKLDILKLKKESIEKIRKGASYFTGLPLRNHFVQHHNDVIDTGSGSECDNTVSEAGEESTGPDLLKGIPTSTFDVNLQNHESVCTKKKVTESNTVINERDNASIFSRVKEADIQQVMSKAGNPLTSTKHHVEKTRKPTPLYKSKQCEDLQPSQKHLETQKYATMTISANNSLNICSHEKKTAPSVSNVKSSNQKPAKRSSSNSTVQVTNKTPVWPPAVIQIIVPASVTESLAATKSQSSVTPAQRPNKTATKRQLMTTHHVQKRVLPRATLQGNPTKKLSAVSSMQQPSPKSNPSSLTEKYILPSGFLMNKATNQMLHTYHFNDNNFVMIENKLCQIHVKTSDGMSSTKPEEYLPSTTSTSTTSQPGTITAELIKIPATASSTVLPISTLFPSKFNTSTDTITSGNTINCSTRYQTAANMFNPPAVRPSQSLNLMIMTTTPSGSAMQSTQVIRKPLMSVSGMNNVVRVQLRETLDHKFDQGNPRIPATSSVRPGVVRLPVTIVQSTASRYKNPINASATTVISTPVTAQPVISSYQRNGNSVRSHELHTTIQTVKSRPVSPRTARCLSSTTFVMTDTYTPVVNAVNIKQSVSSTNVIAPSIEYVYSRVLSPNLSENPQEKAPEVQLSKTSTGQQKQSLKAAVTSQSEIKINVPVSSNIDPQLFRFWKATVNGPATRDKIEDTSEPGSAKPVKRRPEAKHCNKISEQEVTQCSKASMDSFICLDKKRKRKGTPSKKVYTENIVLPFLHGRTTDSPPQTPEGKCIKTATSLQTASEKKDKEETSVKYKEETSEKSKKETSLKTKNHTNGKSNKELSGKTNQLAHASVKSESTKIIGEPVPFLDYPARIISTSKIGNKEIVASPRERVRSGETSDTSSDDEKIANINSFTNLLEENSNEEACGYEKQKRKRLFKLRKINSSQVNEDDERKGNTTTDSYIEMENYEDVVHLPGDNVMETASRNNQIRMVEDTVDEENEILVNIQVNKKETKAITLSTITSNQDNEQKIIKDKKNNFKFDQITFQQLGESSNESNELYDSSDLESYENFVSNRRENSDMIIKSRLIDSYYKSQGTKEIKRCSIEANQCFPLVGSYVMSESSPKITESLIVDQEKTLPTDSTLNITEMEMIASSEKIKPKGTEKITAGLCSKSSSEIVEAKKDSRMTEVKSVSECNVSPSKATEIKTEINQSGESQNPSTNIGSKQTKRLIKTKFIILKGDICERWFEVKRKTGFGEMSDPKFIHYLIRLEEERQSKMNGMSVTQIEKMTCKDVICKTSSDNVNLSPTTLVDSSADISSNTNDISADSESEFFSDHVDLEYTIVNVTDTLPSSPINKSFTADRNCNSCFQKYGISLENSQASSSMTSSQETGDYRSKIIPCPVVMVSGAALVGNSRKRHLEDKADTDSLVTKKWFPFLSDTTQRQIQWAVKLFREWLKVNGEEDAQFEYRDTTWLDKHLSKFYAGALSPEGTPYPVENLQTFRRSLSLYLASNSNLNNVHISIAQDWDYRQSNNVLADLMVAETRKRSVHTTEAVDIGVPISEADMQKLYTSRTLSDDNPTCLTLKVWFDITFHLCKGKLPANFWRSLIKQSLILESDVNGVYYTFADYVYLPAGEEPGKMYATPNDPEKCPVRSTSLFLSKLCANCDALFQCSRRSWCRHQEKWYLPRPISRERLDKMMAKISAHAKLSRVYNLFSVLFTATLHGQSK